MPLPKPLSDIQKDVEDYIRAAQSMDALQYLQGLLPTNADKRQQFILLQGQLTSAKTDNGLFLIDNAELGKAVARINQTILDLSGSLSEADFEEGTATAVKTPVAKKPKFVIVYAEEDQEHSALLNKHLTILVKITQKISVYNVYEAGGDQLMTRAEEEMKTADYLLVLVTANLFVSDWFNLVLTALGKGKRIIPIIISNTLYKGSGLEKFRVLPKGMPVEDFPSKDKAYASIAEELARLVPQA